MTPLNSIISNAKIVKKRIEDFKKKHPKDPDVSQETIKLAKMIELSGKSMMFYNLNQITRMKIHKGNFEEKRMMTESPEQFLVKVIQPFTYMISNR